MEGPVYREVDGYYISKFFDEATVRSALGYVPQPGDVFIVSYPKCGTTWLEHIVYNILNGREPPRSLADQYRDTPFLELQGADATRNMRRPGSIKTHMPFHLQPYSKDAKYIYICRNPYDCCVSYYHHVKSRPFYRFCEGTFDEFFEMFLAGKVDFGDYFVHLMSWYERREDPNVLFVTYEDLKEDTAAWVMKIADFLGADYGRKLRSDEGALQKVLERTSIEAMKKHVNAAYSNFKADVTSIPEDEKPDWIKRGRKAVGECVAKEKPVGADFVRKGVIGDWTGYFSAEQVKRLKQRIAFETRGSDVMDLWNRIQLP